MPFVPKAWIWAEESSLITFVAIALIWFEVRVAIFVSSWAIWSLESVAMAVLESARN